MDGTQSGKQQPKEFKPRMDTDEHGFRATKRHQKPRKLNRRFRRSLRIIWTVAVPVLPQKHYGRQAEARRETERKTASALLGNDQAQRRRAKDGSDRSNGSFLADFMTERKLEQIAGAHCTNPLRRFFGKERRSCCCHDGEKFGRDTH